MRKVARGAVAWSCLALVGGPLRAQAPEEPPRYSESVEVARVIVDVRVVSGRGAPLLGLGPADFRVRVDGRAVAVESARWVTGEPAALPPVEAGQTPVLPPQAPGRLVLLLFQKNLFERSRVGGLMKMVGRAREVVDRLEPEDRVAVLLYDSRLRLLCDFTSDRARVRRAVERGVLFEGEPPWAESGFPSLAARLDRAAAGKAAYLESALLELGRALEPLPGAKSLVLFGYGMGRLQGGRVVPENDYLAARVALARARVSAFSLDITRADSHSLEAGLMLLAADTGGFYVRAYNGADQDLALARLDHALQGHYELTLEAPSTPGSHALDVAVPGRGAEVLARRSFES